MHMTPSQRPEPLISDPQHTQHHPSSSPFSNPKNAGCVRNRPIRFVPWTTPHPSIKARGGLHARPEDSGVKHPNCSHHHFIVSTAFQGRRPSMAARSGVVFKMMGGTARETLLSPECLSCFSKANLVYVGASVCAWWELCTWERMGRMGKGHTQTTIRPNKWVFFPAGTQNPHSPRLLNSPPLSEVSEAKIQRSNARDINRQRRRLLHQDPSRALPIGTAICVCLWPCVCGGAVQ